jgi:uncharacterized protein (DUF1778 family)
MELTPYIQDLRDDLLLAAEAGGDESRALADRLTAPLESAVRLALLDALSSAAAEITRELAPGSVEVRLRGRDPEFVVTPPAPAAPVLPPDSSVLEGQAWVSADGDDATMTRINLRLGQDLKDRVEDAARRSGLSVNAWLVRAAAATLSAGVDNARPARRTPRGADRFTGWAH